MFGSAATSPLKCIDIQTGAQRWSLSGFGRGGTILVDKKLLALSERGDLVLIEPNPNAYTEIARFTAFANYDAYTNKCWNVAAVSDGKIFARSTAEAVCLDVSIPALRMLPPKLVTGTRLQLIVGTENGSPIDTGRLANIEIFHSPDIATEITHWTKVVAGLTLENGIITCEVEAHGAAAFYVVTEPR